MSSRLRLPRPEYPRPQFCRPDWLCLNGRWAFGQDAANNGLAQEWWRAPRLPEQILVPYPPESVLSGLGRAEFMPCVWYARRFGLPRGWKGRTSASSARQARGLSLSKAVEPRLLLHFGAVDYEATVWVNGRQVGSHRGGYTPFACEITDAVAGGPNLLVVRAFDDTRSNLQPGGKQSPRLLSFGCHYTRVTGIWQTVWLEPVGRSFVASARMIGDPASGRISIAAIIDRPRAGQTLSALARAEGKLVGWTDVPVTAPAVACEIDLDVIRPWDLENPFLYDLELVLSEGGRTLDRVTSYFGLRSVRLDGPAILLNGRAVFQRLVLDQGFYPDGIYTARRDQDLKRDIVLSQSLGFNGARLHQKVFEPRFLYWADKLGYLVWGEYPNWGIDHANGEAIRRLTLEWAEAVERDFNHPSIVGWCPFNETPAWRDADMLAGVYRLTKALDPTRPVIDTSGYHHVVTDVYDSHNYEQDPGKFSAAFEDFAKGGPSTSSGPPQRVTGAAPSLSRGGKAFENFENQAHHAGQPYFVSEYGGIWWNPRQAKDSKAWGYGSRPRTAKEFIQRYRALTTCLLRHPRMCGFCYTQLYDIEQEVNGLMTYGRRMKFDPKLIAAINRQRAAIEE